MKSQARTVLIVAALLAISTRALGDTMVTVSPVSQTVTAGQTISVDLGVSDVTDLAAAQFDLSFSPSVLMATGIAEGPLTASAGPTLFLPGTIDNAAGSISHTAISLVGPGPGANGTGVIATAMFTAMTAGTALVRADNIVLLDSAGAPLDFTGPATAAVPEPAAVGMAALGLLILLGARKRVRMRGGCGS